MAQEISDIIERLHQTRGLPRLEIEGVGEPSGPAQYFEWIRNLKDGEGDKAVYIINDWYEDHEFITAFRTEHIKLPKAGIESLVEYALSSTGRKASVYAKGTHFKQDERWNDYTEQHDGSPEESKEVLVELSLDLKSEKPLFRFEYKSFLPYPNDLPPIAVANREPLCINCAYVWLEPFGGRDPDFNHCSQMVSTLGALNNLDPQQMKRFSELVSGGVLCPVFDQTKRYIR